MNDIESIYAKESLAVLSTCEKKRFQSRLLFNVLFTKKRNDFKKMSSGTLDDTRRKM